MNATSEEQIRGRIKELAAAFGYRAALVECALFKDGLGEAYWHTHVLKITLQRERTSNENQVLLQKDNFLLIRFDWDLVQVDQFLSKVATIQKRITEGKTLEEQPRFNVGGYQVYNHGGSPYGPECDFVGSRQVNFPIRSDHPYYYSGH